MNDSDNKSLLKYYNLIQEVFRKKFELLSDINNIPEYLDKVDFGHNINIDKNELLETIQSLQKSSGSFDFLLNSKNHKQVKNYLNKNVNSENFDLESFKKLIHLGGISFSKDIEDKQQWCFINNRNCKGKIIAAHSIQKNNELLSISSEIESKQQVLKFKRNTSSSNFEIEYEDISKASTFSGFCHHHDQVFEPIDKEKPESILQYLFLVSFRSFAFSYHYNRSNQDYYLDTADNMMDSLSSVMNSMTGFLESINSAFTDNSEELEDNKEPEKNKEESCAQEVNLRITRFENYRELLIDYLEKRQFEKLDYFIHDLNFVCPIVCSSWLVTQVDFGGNGFLTILPPNNEPYFGFPILLSVLPLPNNKTRIVMARFKDEPESVLYFNKLRNTLRSNYDFEMFISKRIIEKVDNFYLAPDFWNKLNDEEKNIIIKAKNTEMNVFPHSPTEFECINFFDEKYSLTKTNSK
jgi:hypothetical protein